MWLYHHSQHCGYITTSGHQLRAQRTREALTAAKTNGVPLGGPVALPSTVIDRICDLRPEVRLGLRPNNTIMPLW
jgi:hypothetical protein